MEKKTLTKGHAVYFDSCIIDCVLFIARRNYSPNITSCTITREISIVYDDFSFIVRLDDRVRVKYSFQVSTQNEKLYANYYRFTSGYSQFSDLHQRTKCHRYVGKYSYISCRNWCACEEPIIRCLITMIQHPARVTLMKLKFGMYSRVVMCQLHVN